MARYDEAAGGSKPPKKNKMKEARKGSVVWNADSGEQLQVKTVKTPLEKLGLLFPINSGSGEAKVHLQVSGWKLFI